MVGTKCYLCKNSKFKQRNGSVRDNAELFVLECDECGLVFLSSFDHISADHYEKSGMHGDEKPNIDRWLSETYVDDNRRFNFIKEKIVNKSLLDFGCGIGGFIEMVRTSKLASKVAGLEPEKAIYESFKDRNIIAFSNLEDAKSFSKWDIITAFHVIEHLPDPKETLNQLAKLLTKEGEIIIEVPNSDDALLTLFENDAFAHFTYWSQHLFLFNKKTFSKLIDQTELRLNWIKNVQRYPLSNHLYWLSKGLPGGHKVWSFLNDKELNDNYETQLAVLGKTDTIIASLMI